eukprot:5685326-Amphidinium_carterae.1
MENNSKHVRVEGLCLPHLACQILLMPTQSDLLMAERVKVFPIDLGHLNPSAITSLCGSAGVHKRRFLACSTLQQQHAILDI